LKGATRRNEKNAEGDARRDKLEKARMEASHGVP